MSLPLPISSYLPSRSPKTFYHRPNGSGSHGSGAGNQQQLTSLEYLRSRSRVTNLSLWILVGFLCMSVLVNLKSWAAEKKVGFNRDYHDGYQPGTGLSLAEKVLPRVKEWEGLDHLIMVAGHAIYLGSDPSDIELDESWILSDIQKGGSVKTFYKHIKAGVDLNLQDSKSLLVFSGGQTRPGSQTTEGESYLRLALLTDLFPSSTNLRSTTETQALDSYQNLIYSMARFREAVGIYPKKITVIGFGIKKRRFEDLHRKAISWPLENWEYIGIDEEDERKHEKGKEGEEKYGYGPYSQDLYGCHGSLLEKRKERNVARRWAPYSTSCPELKKLLDYCPADKLKLFTGPLPWVG